MRNIEKLLNEKLEKEEKKTDCQSANVEESSQIEELQGAVGGVSIEEKMNAEDTKAQKENLKTFSRQKLALLQCEYDPKSCSRCEKKSSDLKMCSRCKVAMYCSTKCQTDDWAKSHKAKCKEIRRLKAILDTQPEELRNKNEEFNERCNGCKKKSSDLKRCSKCNVAVYCSKQCQVDDWAKSHKVNCKEIRRLQANLETQPEKPAMGKIYLFYNVEIDLHWNVCPEISFKPKMSLLGDKQILLGVGHRPYAGQASTMAVYSCRGRMLAEYRLPPHEDGRDQCGCVVNNQSCVVLLYQTDFYDDDHSCIRVFNEHLEVLDEHTEPFCLTSLDYFDDHLLAAGEDQIFYYDVSSLPIQRTQRRIPIKLWETGLPCAKIRGVVWRDEKIILAFLGFSAMTGMCLVCIC